MKYLQLASTVLLVVSVSSSALADEPSLEPPKPEPLEIPGSSYATNRAQDLFFPSALRLLHEAQALDIAMQQRVQNHYVAFPATPMKTPVHAYISRPPTNDPPTWPKNLMMASSVGMGLGGSALAMGLGQLNNGDSKSSAATWTGVAAVGGILTGLSLTGFIIGLVSRPEPPPLNIIITPPLAKDACGVQLIGTLP
ncbi:hypothetical protein [Polyangium sorediatum]|uniref:Integral membrane protein n=1 Tax=Polyangium sorediatum TaxID=889274 RepID=A0ABT6P501_9BACT|nr:hypothetical protein [Polyangium sorediatum]MDI1435688.1 hypothetical protein [Polyangium sorediatum]